MSKQGWQEVFVIGQSDGAALTASVTPTSIIPAAARFTLPPNFFSEVGKAIRVRGAGRVTTVTTPGTLTLDIRLGPTGNIVVFNGGAMALNATAQTNATWEFEAILHLGGDHEVIDVASGGVAAQLVVCAVDALSVEGRRASGGAVEQVVGEYLFRRKAEVFVEGEIVGLKGIFAA